MDIYNEKSFPKKIFKIKTPLRGLFKFLFRVFGVWFFCASPDLYTIMFTTVFPDRRWLGYA